MKTYKVIVTQLVEREFTVDALSPEAAESTVVNYLDDGEPGVVTNNQIETIEAFESDDTPSEE